MECQRRHPIETIHVSQRGGFGRTLIDAADYDIPALGYVMRYRDLAANLDARIEAAQRLNECAVVAIRLSSEAAEITLAGVATATRAASCTPGRPCRGHSRATMPTSGCTITAARRRRRSPPARCARASGMGTFHS
jgi:hypothetical protein